MRVSWIKRGLIGIFVLVLLVFFFSPQVQAQDVSVSVSVDPKEAATVAGSTITFEVEVTNESSDVDTFLLKVGDNAGWGLKLSENLLEDVENGTSWAVTLTVTIPENAMLGTRDNVTVTVISQTNPDISSSVSCTARVSLFGVELSILPSEIIKPPGEDATFIVTVKNTGRKVDNYTLEITEGALTKWDPTLDEESFENVAPGENRMTTLVVAVPDDAEEGEWLNVSINASSEADDDVNAVGFCKTKTPMETNWGYFFTGVGVVVAAGVVVVVLWKGPLAGAGG
jgi:uncharacterized membrane protein